MPDLSKTIDKYDTAESHLEGAAKYWSSGRADYLKDWNSFRLVFQKTFIPERHKTDLWKLMTHRVQQPKENISFYSHKKVALCCELNPTTNEIREQIIIGLISRDLSNFVLSKVHMDVDELFRDILDYERVGDSRRGRFNERKEIGRGGQQERSGVTKGNQQEQNVKSTSSSSSKNTHLVRCHYCNEPGHPVQNFSKSRRPRGSCYGCDSIEHLRRDCPNSQSTSRTVPASDRSTLIVDLAHLWLI
ncbi:unnamed protein product [Phaedon cochleariae]|uniref:CCHC-type domain-containing protein n=1 Tax=Phaedon cochleariae TaxID=80249 RepID=A0A9N9SIA2_PHACE|nr:unnamed protein product [Phaedon cochleariae]